MQIQSHRRKINIIALDRDGLLSLQARDFDSVCRICGSKDEEAESVLSSIGFEETADVDGIWTTVWIAVHTETGRIIGAVRMLGNPGEGRELAISLHPAATFEDGDFAYAFEHVCDWIFNHRAVYYLRVKATDEPQIEFLRRYRFVLNEIDGYFEREKNRPFWILMGLCLGMATGVMVSDVFGGITVGLAVGAAFGLAIGSFFDNRDVTRRRPK